MTCPRTPVLVGIGVIQQREEGAAIALEPIDLMIAAVRAAGRDCGVEGALREVERIAVPRGRWSYRNPAGEVGRAIGAGNAKTVLSSVGVLQQSLIADACERIAAGEIGIALVTGGDAGYRLLRARLSGHDAPERQQDHDPDELLDPAAELRHPIEIAAGLLMPVGLYAILDSAARHRAGVSVAAHRDQLADLYARFSVIAADNPHSWDRQLRRAEEIRDAGPRNPMQAFPYSRAHCSSWNVDQAAALLLCSTERASELGIDRSRWVFPLASAESNHMVPVAVRPDLATCVGAEETMRAVLAAVGMSPEEIDLFELYSCFPVAVSAFASALALPAERDLTVTGSMAYAGGPYNNYFLQATCRVAELLRAGDGRTALMTCVSGVLTKQAAAIWSSEPSDANFARIDVSAAVAARVEPRPAVMDFSGAGQVAGYTVLYDRDRPPCAVALLDTKQGRALATSEATEIVERFEQEDWVQRMVSARDNELVI